MRKDEIVLFGNVDIRQVNPAFNVSECVLRIAVEEGSRVVKGQLLASLDSERLHYEVDRAQARVQAQQELVSKMETGSRPDEIDKTRAEANAVCGLLSKSYNFLQPPSKISTC